MYQGQIKNKREETSWPVITSRVWVFSVNEFNGAIFKTDKKSQRKIRQV